jgi:hypothetical protein
MPNVLKKGSKGGAGRNLFQVDVSLATFEGHGVTMQLGRLCGLTG